MIPLFNFSCSRCHSRRWVQKKNSACMWSRSQRVLVSERLWSRPYRAGRRDARLHRRGRAACPRCRLRGDARGLRPPGRTPAPLGDAPVRRGRLPVRRRGHRTRATPSGSACARRPWRLVVVSRRVACRRLGASAPDRVCAIEAAARPCRPSACPRRGPLAVEGRAQAAALPGAAEGRRAPEPLGPGEATPVPGGRG